MAGFVIDGNIAIIYLASYPSTIVRADEDVWHEFKNQMIWVGVLSAIFIVCIIAVVIDFVKLRRLETSSDDI